MVAVHFLLGGAFLIMLIHPRQDKGCAATLWLASDDPNLCPHFVYGALATYCVERFTRCDHREWWVSAGVWIPFVVIAACKWVFDPQVA